MELSGAKKHCGSGAWWIEREWKNETGKQLMATACFSSWWTNFPVECVLLQEYVWYENEMEA